MPNTHAIRQERKLSIGLRRALVTTMYGSYAVHAIVRFANPEPLWIWMAGLGCWAITLFAAIALFHRTPYYNWGNAPDEQLDEREQRTRNHYYRTAYAVFAGLTSIGLIYASIAVEKGWWLPNTYEQASVLVWASLLLGITLPSAMLAWNDNPPAEE